MTTYVLALVYFIVMCLGLWLAINKNDLEIYEMVEKGKQKNFNRTSFEDSAVLREVNDVLTRRFGKNIWLKGMYNDEVIYIGCEKHHSIKIRIEVVE